MPIKAESLPESDTVNLANALDLSESEEEDDIEDLFDDFNLQNLQIEAVRFIALRFLLPVLTVILGYGGAG